MPGSRLLSAIARRMPLLLPVVAALALTAATITQAQTLWFQVLTGEINVSVEWTVTPTATPTEVPCDTESAVLSLGGDSFVMGGGPFELQLIVSNSGGNDALEVLIGFQTNGGAEFVDRVEFANSQTWLIDGVPSGTLYAVGAIPQAGQSVIDYTVYMRDAWLTADAPEARFDVAVTAARCVGAAEIEPLLITLVRDAETPTPTSTATETSTPHATDTPDTTPTPKFQTSTAEPSRTAKVTRTVERTGTPAVTGTPDVETTSTPYSTNTAVPTSTATVEGTQTAPTETPDPTDTPQKTAVSTTTPYPVTETPEPDETPTVEPTATSTRTPVPTSTVGRARASTSTPTPVSTATSTSTPVSETEGAQSTPTLVSEALPSQEGPDSPDVGALPDTGASGSLDPGGGRAWWAIILAGMAAALLGIAAALGRKLN